MASTWNEFLLDWNDSIPDFFPNQPFDEGQMTRSFLRTQFAISDNNKQTELLIACWTILVPVSTLTNKYRRKLRLLETDVVERVEQK